MGDWLTGALPTLPVVTPFSEECLGPLSRYFGGTAAASATAGSQVAQFFPWTIEAAIKIVKGIVMNGASVNGNLDVAVYDHEFNRVVSMGATTQAGTNAVQELDITDTVLLPGRYWMAFLCTGSGTVFARSAADEISLGAFAILEQTAQTALPSTATAVKSTAATPLIPVFGFSTETTI